MDRGRQRRRQADAAVAVPLAIDFDRGKKERQRGRREHVIDAKVTGNTPPLGTFPRLDAGIIARLYPRHRLPRGVARGGQRNRAQPSGAKALRDAFDAAAVAQQDAIEHFSQRRAVHHASCWWERVCPTRQQPAAPSHTARGEIPQVHPEHVFHADVAPHLGEVLDFLGERLLPRGRYAALMPPAETPVRIPGTTCGNSRASRRESPPDTRRARRHRSTSRQGQADSSNRSCVNHGLVVCPSAQRSILRDARGEC